MEIRNTVKEKISDPEMVAKIFAGILATESELDRDKEHFWVAGLKTNNVIKYIDLVSLGTLNASLVHPREIFRGAIQRGVAAILLCHNHPSGDTSPSHEDKVVTERLNSAGKILGIEILDHVLIGDDSSFYSFKENSLL